MQQCLLIALKDYGSPAGVTRRGEPALAGPSCFPSPKSALNICCDQLRFSACGSSSSSMSTWIMLFARSTSNVVSR